MADIVDLPALLAQLQGFPPLQRVLLATAGTLQGTLSAYLGAPVTVDVVSQTVRGASVHREVELVCKEQDLVACRATTEIRVADERMRQLIIERSIGLGQIVALLGERTQFELDEVADEPDEFWRRYRMWGDSFSYVITETFPKELYAGL
jgi:chorismate-pyruvate lyase